MFTPKVAFQSILIRRTYQLWHEVVDLSDCIQDFRDALVYAVIAYATNPSFALDIKLNMIKAIFGSESFETMNLMYRDLELRMQFYCIDERTQFQSLYIYKVLQFLLLALFLLFDSVSLLFQFATMDKQLVILLAP